MECLKRWVIELFLLYIFSGGSVAKISNSMKTSIWNVEGWKLCQWMFVRVKISPRSPRNRKTKNTKKMGNWYCWTDTVAKTSRTPPQKKKNKFRPMERVWGEAGQVTWGETLCFFFVPMGFGAFLGQGGKNLEKTKQTHNKKNIDPWRGSEEKLDRWHGVKLFFNCFSMVLDQLFPLSEFGLFVWEFVIDPSSRNGSRSADRMILSRQYKTCALLRCARLHPPWSSLL